MRKVVVEHLDTSYVFWLEEQIVALKQGELAATDSQQLKPKMPSFADVTKDVQFMTVDEGNKAFVVYSNIAQHFGH
jgi:hypothetical protein